MSIYQNKGVKRSYCMQTHTIYTAMNYLSTPLSINNL